MRSLVILLLFLVGLAGDRAQAAVIIGSPSFSYFDDFTGFDGDADPANWVTTDVSNTSGWRGTGTGSSTTGGKYSFGDTGSGATFDGSLGFLPSGDRSINADILFQNATGNLITQFTVSYDAEHWRSTLDGRNNGWAVSYSIDGGTFAALNDLAYVAANTNSTGINPDDGPWETVSLSQTVTGLSIGNGSEIVIRFFGDNGSGSDARQGVAIDNFSFHSTAVPEPGSALILLSLVCTPAMRWLRTSKWISPNPVRHSPCCSAVPTR